MSNIPLSKYNPMIEELNEMVQPSIEELGYELVETKFNVFYNKLNLTFFIYKKEGIDMDDCEKVHNIISEKLDAIEDKFDVEYVLNVSSPGLDRPICTNDDFRRNLNQDIEIVENKDNAKKTLHGILISYNDEEICLEVQYKNKKETINVERRNITKARPFVKF